jgi:hypothetical protein
MNWCTSILAFLLLAGVAHAQTTLTTKADGKVSARLTWTHVKTSNTALTGFQIQRQVNSTWSTIQTVAAGTPVLHLAVSYSTVVADLTPGTYTYRVVAYNGSATASGGSVVAQVVLIALPVPPQNVHGVEW